MVQTETLEQMVQNLENRQTEISGVDINKEAAEMIIFQQMFAALAKYLSAVQSSLSELMKVL